jgi:hypothetical protein
MASGVIRTCEIANSIGPNKPFNQHVIEELKIGSIHNQNISLVLNNIVANFDVHKLNAIRLKHRISIEIKQTIRNMHEWFAVLESNPKIWNDRFPKQYALS